MSARSFPDHPALPGRTNHLRAGVLVPLSWRGATLQTVVTLRPDRLSRHGGEVSFAGGRPEPEDVDLAATALREAREELGLQEATILGRLSSIPVYTSEYRLEPYVAEIADGTVFQPDPGEVEEVLYLDLAQILADGTVEAVAVPRMGRVWQMPIFRPGGHVLFGATAITVMELLAVLAEIMGQPSPALVTGGLDFEHLLMHKAAAGR